MSGLTAWERWELASLDTLETPANESAAEDAPAQRPDPTEIERIRGQAEAQGRQAGYAAGQAADDDDGDPAAGRSHFEAQDALESGLSGARRTDAGLPTFANPRNSAAPPLAWSRRWRNSISRSPTNCWRWRPRSPARWCARRSPFVRKPSRPW